MKQLVFGMLAGFLLAGTADAGPYEDAIQALDQGNLDTSLKLLRQAGSQGNVTAQNLLGDMYKTGYLHIRSDPVESVKWYRKAADRLHRNAQFRLGQSYESGTGVTRNPVLAFMWYELAATGNHRQARHNRDRLAARMDDAQLAEARRLARDWRPGNP